MENKRKLAHIEKIEWIKSIEGADNIELIGVLGWVLIAKIGEFKVGDLCAFFEIDSKLPKREWSKFLENKHYKVKTYKLGKFKVISQGLALPISVIPELNNKRINIGDDITELLNVKYSVEEDNIRKASNKENTIKQMCSRKPNLFKKPIVKIIMKYKLGRNIMFFIFGKKKDKDTAFPTKFNFIHKTDETRIENEPWLLNDKTPYYVTEKLDGTSCTYILERKPLGGAEFYVCSRNMRMLNENQECYHGSNIYWELAKKYNIKEKLQEYLDINKDIAYVCIQGEGVGFVQGNPYKLKENELYIFNFIDSKRGRISPNNIMSLIHKWKMKWVPILDENYILPDIMEEFKDYATAKSLINPNILREGIVLRNERHSFKNVSREYLLKHNI